jgi:hypothetical protein
MPGSRHTPMARPACDTVTAEPGQSLLARPTAETASLLPHCRLRAVLPVAGRPGRDDDREPARVTTTAEAQDEPMLSARTSPAYRRPASRAPGQPMLAGNLASRASAEVLGLLRRCVTGFGQTPVMVTHDPVAAAYPRPDSRRPAGWRRVPRRRSRACARLPGTPARPCRIRLDHPNFAKITAPSPGSIPHRKARAC